jgi:hypothetical protein
MFVMETHCVSFPLGPECFQYYLDKFQALNCELHIVILYWRCNPVWVMDSSVVS